MSIAAGDHQALCFAPWITAPRSSPPSPSPRRRSELAALAGAADWLEVRADLVGDLDPAPLRAALPRPAPLHPAQPRRGGRLRGLGRAPAAAAPRRRRALRPGRPRGRARLSPRAARRRPARAAPPLLARRRRRRSTASRRRFERMAAMPARALQAGAGGRAAGGGAGAAPAAARRSGGRDVAAFAAGPLGALDALRRAAPRRAAWSTAPLGRRPGGAGAARRSPACARDYGLPELPPVEALFGVVGNPVAHSLSPRLHNAAYRALGLPVLYLPFHAPVASATSGWRWWRAACWRRWACRCAASR